MLCKKLQLTAFFVSLSLLGSGGGAWAASGAEESTVLLQGGVQYAGYGTNPGSYLARGLAEILLSRHLGLRIEGYAHFDDPAITDKLKIRQTAAVLGLTVHLAPGSLLDPYFSTSVGGVLMTGDGPLAVSPSLQAATGINYYVGAFFFHAQASWQYGNMVLRSAAPSLSDLRVTAGLGWAFDFSRK